MKKLVVLDANALMHRAYHALPPLKNKEGKIVNAVYGFLNILFKIINDLKPDYLSAAFDVQGPTFRNLEYQDYKAKRVKPSQEFYDQIPIIKEFLRSLSIPIYQKKGFEADDVIGTIVTIVEAAEKEIKIIIVSGDLDILQLASQQTEVHSPVSGMKETRIYNQQEIKKRYQISPEQIIDLKALKGDPSDNIPGVPGIGEKTAVNLIKKFGSLKNLYQDLGNQDIEPKLKARLMEYKEKAFFSYGLVSIKKDVPIIFNLEQCRWHGFNQAKVVKLLEKMQFKTLLKRINSLI